MNCSPLGSENMGEVFYCKSCGKEIFSESQIIEEITLSDFKDYQAKAYKLKDVINLDSFRRYDSSLHEGKLLKEYIICKFLILN